MAMQEEHADRRWWASKKKDHKSHPLPSAPPSSWLLSPGEISSSALPHKHGAADQLTQTLSPIHHEEDNIDAELTQKVALIMQKELQRLRCDLPAKPAPLLPESLPRNTHKLQEPHLGVNSRSSLLEMQQMSIIKALELENAGSLEKQQELQEEVEMLKGVITAVSDEKEELQEEVAMLKVSVRAVSLEKEELQEEVEMLKDVIRSVASEREQNLLKIRVLEMELEENFEERQRLAEEVERLRSELQYVVTVQVQEFSY